MKKAVFALVSMLVCASFSFADIPRPDLSPSHTPKPQAEKLIDTGMEIRLDADAKEAKLLIPKSQIKELRAALEQLDQDSGDTAAVTTNNWSRTQTIVS